MTTKLSQEEIAEQARGTFQAGDYLEAAQAFGLAAAASVNSNDAPTATGMKKILFVLQW